GRQRRDREVRASSDRPADEISRYRSGRADERCSACAEPRNDRLLRRLGAQAEALHALTAAYARRAAAPGAVGRSVSSWRTLRKKESESRPQVDSREACTRASPGRCFVVGCWCSVGQRTARAGSETSSRFEALRFAARLHPVVERIRARGSLTANRRLLR